MDVVLKRDRPFSSEKPVTYSLFLAVFYLKIHKLSLNKLNFENNSHIKKISSNLLSSSSSYPKSLKKELLVLEEGWVEKWL